MTELEKEELDTNEELDTDLFEEEEDKTSDDDQEGDEDQITWEQAQEWKKKALRAEKAEKKLVELKKQLKEKTVEKEKKKYVDSSINPKDEVKRILAEERFYEKNPEAEAYRDLIEKYQDKGLSLDDAYLLASKKDREIDKNREVYGKSILKGSTSTDSFNLLTLDEYDNLSDEQLNEYEAKTKAKYGGVRFK